MSTRWRRKSSEQQRSAINQEWWGKCRELGDREGSVNMALPPEKACCGPVLSPPNRRRSVGQGSHSANDLGRAVTGLQAEGQEGFLLVWGFLLTVLLQCTALLDDVWAEYFALVCHYVPSLCWVSVFVFNQRLHDNARSPHLGLEAQRGAASAAFDSSSQWRISIPVRMWAWFLICIYLDLPSGFTWLLPFESCYVFL